MLFDAVILAGGAARRLEGAAKPQLTVDGVTLLDRVVAAVAGARTTVVVGPQQPVSGPVRWARESPPGGGPVAALAAALPLVTAPVVLTLAADLPWLAPAVPVLLDAVLDAVPDAVPGVGAAVLVDATGRRNHLAAAWRTTALRDAVDGLAEIPGAAMGALLRGTSVVEVADRTEAGVDCDTWDDLRRARHRARDQDPHRS